MFLLVVDLKENILVVDGDRFVEDPVLVLRSVEVENVYLLLGNAPDLPKR